MGDVIELTQKLNAISDDRHLSIGWPMYNIYGGYRRGALHIFTVVDSDQVSLCGKKKIGHHWWEDIFTVEELLDHGGLCLSCKKCALVYDETTKE